MMTAEMMMLLLLMLDAHVEDDEDDVARPGVLEYSKESKKG